MFNLTWVDINLERAEWRIPAEHCKSGDRIRQPHDQSISVLPL
jgi:hypothetical protein